jgi:hypothetical protein
MKAGRPATPIVLFEADRANYCVELASAGASGRLHQGANYPRVRRWGIRERHCTASWGQQRCRITLATSFLEMGTTWSE